MPAAPLPPDESTRLETLNSLGLWDTAPEERFDRITRMATRALGVANACVNLVGEDRVFTKSSHGHAMNSPRGAAFCAYTILDAGALVVPDAPSDSRFADFPQVTGKPFFRFYAGCPITAPDGSRIGTLCVTDRVPRVPSDEDLQALADFALMAQGELQIVELSSSVRAAEAEQEELRQKEERFREIADVPGSFIWETTLEGKTTYVSERVDEVLGFTAAEVLARGFFDGIVAADIVMATAQFFYSVRKSQRFTNLEFRYETRDGRTIWLSARGAPRFSAEGKMIGYRGFVEEITEQHEIREAQVSRRESAEKAASKQAEYLKRLSQDIRGPVNALVGLAGQLSDQRLPAEAQRQAAQIRENADNLLAMVTDLTDFANIESGLLEFENHPFTLQILVEDVILGQTRRAVEKGLEMHWHIAPGMPQGFHGDETRLRQILTNLLVNAIANTATGDVSLSVSPAENETGDQNFVLFSVWDTGPGHSPEELEHIFDRQGGDSTEDGLPISRSLAELMGGRMWAESEPGKGSCLHVAVPLQEAEAPDPFEPNEVLRDKTLLIAVTHPGVRVMLEAFAQDWGMQPLLAGSAAEMLKQAHAATSIDAIWVDESLSVEHGNGVIHDLRKQKAAGNAPLILLRLLNRSSEPTKNLPNGYAAAMSRPAPYRETHQILVNLIKGEKLAPTTRSGARSDASFASKRPMRILIADDNAMTQKALAGQLAQFGYRPDWAHNGHEVLEALGRQPYDVIFMDLEMPEMNGLEATRRVREKFTGAARPWIIGMAPPGAEIDRDATLSAGIDSHVSKPARHDVLEQELVHASDNVGLVVDFSGIARFLDMTGTDRESIHELVEIFAEQTLGTLNQLRSNIEGRQSNSIVSQAVQLRQNSANFGAARMQQLCDGLQAAGKAADFPLAKEYVERLGREYMRVKAELDAYGKT